jgi:hypothetical protein
VSTCVIKGFRDGPNHLHDALRPEVVHLPFLDGVADVGALDGELEEELPRDRVMKPRDRVMKPPCIRIQGISLRPVPT